MRGFASKEGTLAEINAWLNELHKAQSVRVIKMPVTKIEILNGVESAHFAILIYLSPHIIKHPIDEMLDL